jgi:hypothetical protein
MTSDAGRSGIRDGKRQRSRSLPFSFSLYGSYDTVVHPLSITVLRLTPASRLRPGCPAAPRSIYLPLLPSGSDGVHRLLPRRTRPSTPLNRRSPKALDLEREFNPAVADCGCRAPLAPRLARHLILRNRALDVKAPWTTEARFHRRDAENAEGHFLLCSLRSLRLCGEKYNLQLCYEKRGMKRPVRCM